MFAPAPHWIPAILFLRDLAPSRLSNFIKQSWTTTGGTPKMPTCQLTQKPRQWRHFILFASLFRSCATDEVSAKTGHASNNLAVKQEDCVSSAYRDACLCSNGLGQKNLPPWDLNKSSWQGRHMLRLSALSGPFQPSTNQRNPTPNGQSKNWRYQLLDPLIQQSFSGSSSRGTPLIRPS